MNKKECKKLINEIIKDLDNQVEFYVNQLNKNNNSKSKSGILFKFSYDVIKEHLETIRDRKLDDILNKIDNNKINKRYREEKEDVKKVDYNI